MIALLSSLSSWCQNSNTSLRGGADSVIVAVEDLRIASEKMVQLKYVKQELDVYKHLHNNDSIRISGMDYKFIEQQKQLSLLKKQRNIFIIVSSVLLGVISGIVW